MDHGPCCGTLVTMRMIGIDLGQRRIGIAVSDATATLARPLRTLDRGASDDRALDLLCTAIDEIAEEEPIGGVVVGMPTRLDGTDNAQTPRVKKMVTLLTERLTVPVVIQDERLSSHEANERLAFKEKDWRKRKARLDAAAAAVILQDDLDAQSRSGMIGEADE